MWYREVIWRAISRRDGAVCHECGGPLEFLEGDIHHNESRANELENLVLLHTKCHAKVTTPGDYEVGRATRLENERLRRLHDIPDHPLGPPTPFRRVLDDRGHYLPWVTRSIRAQTQDSATNQERRPPKSSFRSVNASKEGEACPCSR
jgi:hypothetical protein